MLRVAKRRSCFARLWLGLATALLLSLILGAAGAPTASEQEVKASFLYNCTKFVEWPTNTFDSTNAPIRFAVFGDDEFGAKLKTLLANKKAHGRSFEVQTISNAQEARNFHILFIPGSEGRRATPALEATNKRPVLTIGESEQFVELGGMISIFFEDEQLAFEVSASSAQKAGLEISSHLLRLSKKRRAK
jgi:hypothetical protein